MVVLKEVKLLAIPEFSPGLGLTEESLLHLNPEETGYHLKLYKECTG